MLRAIAIDVAAAFNFLPEPPKQVSVEDNTEGCRGSRACGKALTLLQFFFSALLIACVILITKDEILQFPLRRKIESRNTGDDRGGDPPSASTVQGLFEEFEAGDISLLSCPCDSPTMRLGDVLTPLANSKQIDFTFDPIASLGVSDNDGVSHFVAESTTDMNECLNGIDAASFKTELGNALSKANLLASFLELQLAQLLARDDLLPTLDYNARRAYFLQFNSSPANIEAQKSEMLDRFASTSIDQQASLARSVCEFAFGIATLGGSYYPKQKWATRTCGNVSLVPWRLAGAFTEASGAHNFAFLQAQRKSKFAMEMTGVISSLRQFANEFRDDLVPNATFVTQSAVSRKELERLVNDTLKQQQALAGARGDVLVPGAISGDSTLFETECRFRRAPSPPLTSC